MVNMLVFLLHSMSIYTDTENILQLIENKLLLVRQHLPSLLPNTVTAALQSVAVISDHLVGVQCRSLSSRLRSR